MTDVMVVDDQTLVRQGIRTLLELGGISVVAEASDGAERPWPSCGSRPRRRLLR